MNANTQAGILVIQNAIASAVAQASATATPVVPWPPLPAAVVNPDFVSAVDNAEAPHADPKADDSKSKIGNVVAEVMNPPPLHLPLSGKPDCRCSKPCLNVSSQGEKAKKAKVCFNKEKGGETWCASSPNSVEEVEVQGY